MKNKYLEFIRAIACVIVVFGHVITLLPAFQTDRPLFLQAFGAWGREAVIIFFVLSGIVINYSQQRDPKNTLTFISNRLVRLVPIYWAAIILVLIIDYVTNSAFAGIGPLIGNALFLGTLHGHLFGVFNTNPAVWSLSFEMFFYMVFALTIGKNQLTKIYLWGFLGLISMYFYYVTIPNALLSHIVLMLSFSTIWIAGYLIFQFRNSLYANIQTSVFALSMIPMLARMHISDNYYDIVTFLLITLLTIPVFLFVINEGAGDKTNKIQIKIIYYVVFYIVLSLVFINYSKSLLMSKMIYLSLPLFSLLFYVSLIRKIVKSIFTKLENILLFLGKISYPLYLVHLPFIYLWGRWYPESIYVNVVLIITSSLLTAFCLEYYFQKKVNMLFKKVK